MAKRLHTRVSDAIRDACTHNGVLDTVQQAEMRMESAEYRNEVMGFRYPEVDVEQAQTALTSKSGF